MIKRKNYRFTFKSFPLTNLSAMIARNGGQSVVGIILRLFPAMQVNLSPFKVTLVKQVLRTFSKIFQSQGPRGFVKYLKSCSVVTQQALAGYRINDISPRVSRTSSGLPRILPPLFRKLVRSNTSMMKLALTLFSLFRDILYKSPAKTKTITAPFTGSDKVVLEVIKYIPRFVRLFSGKKVFSRRIFVSNRFKYFAINKSSPSAFKGLSSTNPFVLWNSALALSEDQIKNLHTLGLLVQPVMSDDQAPHFIKLINNCRKFPF